VFVHTETREAPQHVGTLLRFGPRPDGAPGHLRDVLRTAGRAAPVVPPWNRKLATPGWQHNPVHTWVTDDAVDVDYHVRRTAVASPGDERELGVLIGRLHAAPLDLSKPPWELHVVEGLADGGFAMFLKVHHALVDGYTLTRTVERAFTSDPDTRGAPLFFQVPAAEAPTAGWSVPGLPTGEDVRSAVALSRALGRLALRRGPLVASLDAPDTIFNRRITRNRRFATQDYPLAQLKGLAKATGTTLNDVVLAVCGGGLRSYLLEQGALPASPLVAFVPVDVRPAGDPGGGNAVGGMLASLGTDVADPVERLRAVHASTSQAKRQLEGMTRDAVLAYSQALLSPLGWQTWSAVAGLAGQARTCNVTISNVPGPKEPRWFEGARLQAAYPASIVHHGLALNITLFSYAGGVHVGFTGCRDTVPHLQRLAVRTGEALTALDAAVGGPRD
jgi:WS/DGAT/MGAT family acyltransferase